jgi:AcrR family transcriptional regulator
MEQPSDRRKELLDSIVDTMLKNGVADLSLRPLAEAVGTSARLLIYHFDTKENLLVCALDEVRLRIATSLRALPDRKPSGPLKDSLLRFWTWATAEENQNYFRLLFEVDGLCMYDQLRFSKESRLDSTAVWLKFMGDTLAMDKAAVARATLVIAAITGLLQEFLSTGDNERTSAALSTLIAALSAVEPTAAQKKTRARA